MPIPPVNVDEVSQGIIGVQMAILQAISSFGNSTVVLFLVCVPERGEQLWQRLRSYQSEHRGAIFSDFVKSVLMADPVKLFFPRECTLHRVERNLLASEVQAAVQRVGVRSNEGVLNIYFGEGPAYNAARNISCRGCPMSRCKHYLSPGGRGKRW